MCIKQYVLWYAYFSCPYVYLYYLGIGYYYCSITIVTGMHF